MRIECPGCEARYEVPDTRLAPGRSVRCARCGRDWTPVSAEAPPPFQPDPAPPVVEDPPANPPRRPHPFALAPRSDDSAPNTLSPDASPPNTLPKPDTPPSRRSRTLIAAWAVSVAAVLAFVGFAVLLREPIARAWPPSLRVYDALSLPMSETR